MSSPSYRNGLRCRWEELRTGPLHTDSVNYFIDSMATYLTDARIRNFTKWPIIGQYVNWNAFVGATYEEDLSFLKQYIETRSLWMDANIPGICDLAVEEQAFVPQYCKAWPNPMSDVGYIGFTLFKNDAIQLELYDLTGRVVLTEDFGKLIAGEHAAEISTSQLLPGNYIYTLKGETETLFTGKIIIKK